MYVDSVQRKVFLAKEAKKPLVKPVEAVHNAAETADFRRQPKQSFKQVYDSFDSKLRNEERKVTGYDRHGKRVVL